jgi:general secretion pathway protein H
MRGYSLLEMVVVLAVISLLLGALQWTRFGDNQALTLRAEADQLVGALRQVRSLALSQGAEKVLSVDVANKTWQSDGGAVHKLPDDLDIVLSSGAELTSSRTIGVFAFYPRGGSSGGAVDLRGGPDALSIRIDWLTGRVQIVEP